MGQAQSRGPCFPLRGSFSGSHGGNDAWPANVVTRGCGNSEVVEDNQTGFIANAATVEAFDEALERAWQRRSELSSMGVLAARRIRELTPEDACLGFAERLLGVFS